MTKDLIKLLITEYQYKTSKTELVERLSYGMDDSLNYVFVGLRRAGKSYLMFQQMKRLLGKGHTYEEFLYFNFEDDRAGEMNIGDLDLIKICYEEMYPYRPIFFLDEIQIVTGWEKFARRLADQGYRVYVTGSNAKMLSSEMATTLGGRYMIKNIYPYSFAEYLLAKRVPVYEKNALYKHQKEIITHYETYFGFGGLPEVMRVSDKREWLSNLYQKIFFGDLLARYQIRNDFAMRLLIKKLAESVKQPSSYNRLANVVSASGKKISTDTIIDYLSYLKDSWLIFSVENICAKLAEKASNKKYYFMDNGILNLFLFDAATALLENQVAIRLKQRFGDDVYYFQDNTEVDFFLPEPQWAIQVCYSLSDTETRKREVNALLHISKRCSVKKYMIITKDDEEHFWEGEIEINAIPVWKWLLEKETVST